MMRFGLAATLVSILSLTLISNSFAEENPAVEAMQEYVEFADFGEGTITVEQIKQIGADNLVFIDVRLPASYEKSHIPGAKHIEWRQVLGQRDEVPSDKTVVFYCDTGLLSSKTQFAMRVAGWENVKVLVGGYASWVNQ